VTWGIVWWVLTGIFLLNALRLRSHAAHLKALPPTAGQTSAGRTSAGQTSAGQTSAGETSASETSVGQAEAGQAPAGGAGGGQGWLWVTAEGCEVPELLRRQVEAYAASEELDVLDIVPRDLPAEQALQLAGGEDPARYRAKLLAAPLSAQQAVLVEERTWQRMELDGPHEELDPVAMNRVTLELKRHAPGSSDLVVVAGARAAGEDPAKRRAILRSRFGPLAGVFLWFPALRLALLVTGVVLFRLPGAVAAGVWCLAPAISLAGTAVLPRDLAWRVLFRWLLAPLDLVRSVTGRWRPAAGDVASDPESLRPVYEELLAGGTDRFFEPRRPDCPLCGSVELEAKVHAVDLLQRKPGRFVLEQCGACGHVFQNPRLSIEGLDFYYRDFYDGLGEEVTELIFGAMESAYRARSGMLDGSPPPARWIDVGTGHGHFCLAAHQWWPGTVFDGLDMSASIETAARRGWVEHGYRGFLLDVAPELVGRYDVVSMHHYLEHTREPLAELDAAISLLAPRGQLLIELPDPECAWGRALGRYWVPWFQPQHQHMMSIGLLEAALRERGLEVVRRDRCTKDQPVNITGALMLLTMHIAPRPGLPWRRRASVLSRLRFAAALLVAVPLVPVAFLFDRLSLLRLRRRRSNAYRVLARLAG
jgi:SAM-dependent methyltransferase